MMSRKQRIAYKRGKVCEKCGSEFELTLHHDKESHVSRKLKVDQHVVVLCATCHEEEDFSKNMKLFPRAEEKMYEKKNAERIDGWRGDA
jgi:hypothetical protein